MARDLHSRLRRAARLVLIIALLAGCSGPPPVRAPGDPDTGSAAILTPTEIVDALTPPPKPPPAILPAPLIPERAIDLIVSFEVGSPELYTRKYQRPLWPGAESGVTVGIGYDLGYRTPSVIALDWAAHPQHVRLQTASGIKGPIARARARELADVAVEWGLARAVFDQTSIIEHHRQTRRAFGDAFDRARPNAQGALVSLVFNRGPSMAGNRRVEMRAIRDDCLPRLDYACAAAQIRAMSALWAGTPEGRGLKRRRDEEADLMEAP